MKNDGFYGCYSGFRAIIIHTFGVLVGLRRSGFVGLRGLSFGLDSPVSGLKVRVFRLRTDWASGLALNAKRQTPKP